MALRQKANTIVALLAAATVATNATAALWASDPPLNASRGFAATVVDPCGNILVIGGMRRVSAAFGQVVLPDIEQLTFDGTSYSDSWTTLGITLPVERFFHSAVVANGYLYVIGGARWGASQSNVEPILQVDRYDFLTQTWDSTSVPPIPYPNITHASVVDNYGRIWMIGGSVPNSLEARASTAVYDPARPQLGWQTMQSLNTARLYPGAVVDQRGRIWAIGGLSDGYVSHLNTVEILDPCSDAGWTVASATLPGPVPIHSKSVMGADGYIYMTGGWANNWYVNAVRRIDSRDPAATWTTWSSLNLARAAHSVVLGRDGNIYAIGGEAVNVQSQTSVEKLDTRLKLADVNGDGLVNNFDIDLFVLCVLNGGCP
ncbi:MAG: hypothetical protein IPM64_08285 [Phycisphaerales bacterium]|nr:hypothetical protein [Phycisphaerales bacterium]